jgi:hypothetical protein
MNFDNIKNNLLTIIETEKLLNISYSVICLFDTVDTYSILSSPQYYFFGRPVFVGCHYKDYKYCCAFCNDKGKYSVNDIIDLDLSKKNLIED